MTIALKIEDVSKMYRLGAVGTGTLSHDVNRCWAMLRGRPDPTLKIGMENNRAQSGGEYVWALKDINLEVEQGQILGIIGRNGAGKSTLLKLLSRVTAPTSGTIKARGRITSLLEVGTGFHPELTGRENVYLNGAILGMSRSEIKRRLDEIVDFSGCAKYIDTPVKRYSSGMTVRLGFSVAAHLDCEILIVDEVLAVGDAAFQSQAIEKMQDLSRSTRRTILFVSHSMVSVQRMCSSVAVLTRGGVEFLGDTRDGVNHYLSTSRPSSNLRPSERTDRKGNGIHQLEDVWFRSNGRLVQTATTACQISIFLKFKSRCVNQAAQPTPHVALGIYNSAGLCVLNLNTRCAPITGEASSTGGVAECQIPKLPLVAGVYTLNVSLWTLDERADWLESAVSLDVEEGDFFGTGSVEGTSISSVLVPHSWTVNDNSLRNAKDSS